MPDRDRDIPQGGDAGTARPLLRHLFRVLAFDAIWVILPLGVDLLLVWLAPAPDQSPAYALVYIPLEYLSALILTAPVSAFIGSLVWIVAERWSWALRQGAVGISIVAWAVGAILLFVITGAEFGPETWQTGVAILISAPLFGLLMPLPAPDRESP